MTGGGDCVTNGRTPYINGEGCTIEVLATAGVLYSTAFDVEQYNNCSYDFLTIGDQKFCGSAGPDGVAVTAGGTMMTWRSGVFATAGGWTVCWGASRPPSTSPPPSSDSSAAIEMAGSTCRRHSDCSSGGSTTRLAYCRMAIDGPQPQPQHCYGCGHCVNVAQGADVFDRSGVCPPWCRTFAARTSMELRYQAGGSGVPTIPEGTLSGMGRLRRLTIRGYGVTVLEAGAFRGLGRNLSYLTLQYFALNAYVLSDGLFRHCSALRRLYFNLNGLTALPAGLFSGSSRLELIFLNRNALVALPTGLFDGLYDLNHVDLMTNQLTMLPNGIFDTTPNLGTLMLNNNCLTALRPGIFSGTPRLIELLLDDNALSVMPTGVLRGLTTLMHLWLAGNELTQLQPGLFDGLTGLVDLRLHGNSIASGAAASLEPVWAQFAPLELN